MESTKYKSTKSTKSTNNTPDNSGPNNSLLVVSGVVPNTCSTSTSEFGVQNRPPYFRVNPKTTKIAKFGSFENLFSA